MIFSALYYMIVMILYLCFHEDGKTLGEASAGWQIAFTFGLFMPLVAVFFDGIIIEKTHVCKKCEHFYTNKKGEKCCGVGYIYRREYPLKEEKTGCSHFEKLKRGIE